MVFKTIAIVHSAIPPRFGLRLPQEKSIAEMPQNVKLQRTHMYGNYHVNSRNASYMARMFSKGTSSLISPQATMPPSAVPRS